MKQLRLAPLLLSVILVANGLAAQKVVSVPAKVQFPGVAFANPYGYPLTSSASITLINTDEREIAVTQLHFSSPVFSSSTGVPFVLNPGRSKTIDIVFKPSAADQFNGQLDVMNNALLLTTIPLQGVADCWSPLSCEPKGPLCRINKGNETWQPISVPKFFETVSPAIDEQAILHQKGTDYDLPVDFLLRIAGLAGIVHINPALQCDDKQIHFARIPNSRLRARFQRKASSNTTADGTIGNTSVHVSIPSDVSGISIVGGGFSEFHFDKAKEPTLTITSAGEVIFDGPIGCLNATFSSATICHVKAGPTRPDINIEVQ